MAEYIERKAIVNHLRECEGTPPEVAYTYPIFKALECFVEGLPAADVVEVFHGEWLICADGYYPYCSRCWKEPKNGELTNYCPDCGARMDGADVQNT